MKVGLIEARWVVDGWLVRGVGRAVLVLSSVIVFLIAGGSVWWVVTVATAHREEAALKRRWIEMGRLFEALREHFPPRDANASALALEQLAAPLGIQLAPRGTTGRPVPDDAAADAFTQVKEAASEYASRVARSDRPLTEAPPASVRAFLHRNAAALDAVTHHLLTSDEPRWEQDLSLGLNAPLPDLLGQINLTRLLVTDPSATSKKRGTICRVRGKMLLSLGLRRESAATIFRRQRPDRPPAPGRGSDQDNDQDRDRAPPWRRMRARRPRSSGSGRSSWSELTANRQQPTADPAEPGPLVPAPPGLVVRSVKRDRWTQEVWAEPLAPFETPKQWALRSAARRRARGLPPGEVFRAGAVDGIRTRALQRSGEDATVRLEYAVLDRRQRDLHVVRCEVFAGQEEAVVQLVTSLLRRAHWVNAGRPCNHRWNPE